MFGPTNATWRDLHRWADDGGNAERPTSKIIMKRSNQRYWLRKRTQLDAIREASGRAPGYSNRRLEVSR